MAAMGGDLDARKRSPRNLERVIKSLLGRATEIERPLLAAGVVLLGLVGVAAAAAGAREAGGAAVDVGEGADAPAAAGRRRLLPAVAAGGAHRRSWSR